MIESALIPCKNVRHKQRLSSLNLSEWCWNVYFRFPNKLRLFQKANGSTNYQTHFVTYPVIGSDLVIVRTDKGFIDRLAWTVLSDLFCFTILYPKTPGTNPNGTNLHETKPLHLLRTPTILQPIDFDRRTEAKEGLYL